MSSVILILSSVLQIYETMILVYVLMSFLPGSRETQFGQILGNIVEPYLSIFRKVIPPIGMLDFSPFVAYIVLRLATIGLYNFF